MLGLSRLRLANATSFSRLSYSTSSSSSSSSCLKTQLVLRARLSTGRLTFVPRAFSTTPFHFQYTQNAWDPHGEQDQGGDRKYNNQPPPPSTDGSPVPTCVFLGNLPWITQHAEIASVASPYSPADIRVASDNTGRPLGFAHIDFTNLQDAEAFMAAVENGEIRFGDRIQRVDFARHHRAVDNGMGGGAGGVDTNARPLGPPTPTVYVGNLLYSTDEPDLREVMEPFGSIKRINIAYDSNRSPRGFAHVEFVEQEAANAVVRHQPLFCLGRRLRVDYAPMRPMEENKPYQKLYFYEYFGDELALREVLGPMEEKVSSIYFLRNKDTLQPTGTGFIEFATITDATHALEALNNTTTSAGQPIKLQYARSQPLRARRDHDNRDNRPLFDRDARGGGGRGGYSVRDDYQKQDSGDRDGGRRDYGNSWN